MQAIFGSIIRHALTTFGGALVAKGILDASMVEPLVGAILTLAGISFAIINKIRKSK